MRNELGPQYDKCDPHLGSLFPIDPHTGRSWRKTCSLCYNSECTYIKPLHLDKLIVID